MTFDEQLRRAFETLTADLHDEISRKTQQISAELASSAQAEREDAATLAVKQQEHLDEAVAEAGRTRQQLDDALAESQRHRQQFEDAVAETARQQQQLEEAAAEAARLREELAAAALLPAIVPTPALETVAPVNDSAAAERLVNGIRQIDDARSLSEILDTLLNVAAAEVDRVAVLLVRGGRYTGWRSIGFDPPVERGGSVDLPSDAWVIPLDIASETVAVLRAERDDSDGAQSNADSSWPDPTLELLARHAARCLESVTAFKAARAALVQPDDVADDGGGADEDASARRYAKLLVSEIKLYHEPEVVAGRRDRDLTTRLGGEIARARVLYEQRVPTHIREQTDYFQDELVRTLANGDSTLLHLS